MSKKYTKSHEWIEKIENSHYKMGISNYAQEQLGDVVMVELPDEKQKIAVGEEIIVIESVKAASDVYTPVSGEIIENNQQLLDKPALINESAEELGWLVKINIQNEKELEGLMSKAEYENFLKKNG